MLLGWALLHPGATERRRAPRGKAEGRKAAWHGAEMENPRHRDFEIIVQDRDRHAAEEGEGRNMAVEKGLGRLRRIGLDEAGVRLRQIA
jgi:hypothetical protein